MSEVQERVASNLVTSENLAEFTAQKLGLVDTPANEAAEAEPDAEADQSGQDGEGKDATATDEQKKPNPKLERRFSEITKQREAAREEAKREREQRESLEARLKELESRVNPPAQAEADELGQEPKPEQFSDMYEYAKALAEYTADKKLMERDNQEKARKAAAEQEAKFKTWADRVNAAKTNLPDFDDMVQSSDVRVSDPVRDAIIESENGPQILYYLAENSEFAKKLADMSVVSAVREIGKIEARFIKEAPEVKPVAVKSKAPAPINPLRGALNTVDANVDADGNFHGSFQQWKAARQARKIR
jgi:chromosome segregation ATPase